MAKRNIDFKCPRHYFETTLHSFTSCLIYGVFSTKERRPWLTPAICERLWPYLGGIARENKPTFVWLERLCHAPPA